MEYNESERIKNLLQYEILDTPAEQELDELTFIASLIFEVPISLITLLDGQRQWFKSKYGIDISETPQKDALCKEAIKKPGEVLVVNDALKDDRFCNSNLVTGQPNIRFYAGAPLVTPEGHALGTLCVIDQKPREITESQKRGLQLLAQKVMDFIVSRAVITAQKKELNKVSLRLENIANSAPGFLFQFTMNAEQEITFDFASDGIAHLFPVVERKQFLSDQETITHLIHPEDLQGITKTLNRAYEDLQSWSYEYRVLLPHNKTAWHEVRANPKLVGQGVVEWFGTVQDITERKAYEQTLEDIAFDISHVLRRPVTTTMGLAQLLRSTQDIAPSDLRFFVDSIGSVADELDAYTKKLNISYAKKKQEFNERLKAVQSGSIQRFASNSPGHR